MNPKIDSELSPKESELAQNASTAFEGGARLIAEVSEVQEGATRILDFGCFEGDMLMRLKNERNCSELYGVEIRESCSEKLAGRLDKFWITDLSKEDTDLGDAYRDFFNYILMFDVVEHLYDPWYVLPKLSQYLAPEGRLIMTVPNFRYWGLWYPIILGTFPYGQEGGLMNEEHIRWFTWDTLRDLIELSGMEVVSGRLAFPENVDLEKVAKRLQSPITELEVPPPEVDATLLKTRISFPEVTRINSQYTYFLANKIIAVCRKGPHPVPLERVAVGTLEERRKRLKEGVQGKS